MVATRIVRHLIRVVVSDAIHLDCQVRDGAIEVEDIGTNRMLATKVQSVQPATPEIFPKQHFRQRHFPAQVSRPL
jgi:hypothetical protein